MEEDSHSEDILQENSFSALMGTVDKIIDELKQEEQLVIPEGQVGVNRLIRSLKSFQNDIQISLDGLGKFPDMDEIAKKINLKDLKESILNVRDASGASNELLSLANEFGKSRALELMNLIYDICHSISISISERSLKIKDGEVDSENALSIQKLDESTREQIKNLKSLLVEVKDFFPGHTVDTEWRDNLDKIKKSYAKESSLDIGFMRDIFNNSFYEKDYGLVGDDLAKLPTARTFLETIFIYTLENIYSNLRLMFLFQSKAKTLDLEQLLSPIPEIESVNQFADMLVSKAGLLTSVPFEIRENESDEINDLLSKLIFVQTSFLQMLENLEIGLGRYEPTLSDANSHMIVYKESPRTAYDLLPMWPLKRKERYDEMNQLDLYNWLGLEYHSEDLNYDEQHKVAYRDFLDFIQHNGYEYKKVTAYGKNFRVEPKLSTFIWDGKKNKYRSDASIFFYCENCKYTKNEMRISIDSLATPYSDSITVNVGLDFFKKDIGNLEMTDDEQILHQRELAEQFCTNLFKDFAIYQKEHGILKNSKFNAFFEELELKGRTFNDVILSEEKKNLIDDNIFAILNNSKSLMSRGVEINRGIMLAGPPGVGKSLTIDAIIAEGDCTILFADFIMLQQNMDLIFKVARKYAPTILIMEDIDALGITGQRGIASSGSGLSTLLNHMDGIKNNNGVITIATSNHPELLDWALVARPGRFDVRIDYPYPDHKTLKGIFEKKMEPYPQENNINLKKIVDNMPVGFTGSHIQDIVNQANYISVSESSEKTDEAKISQKSLETAFERALYNFNKFLAERPHVKLERGSDSSEVIQSNSKSTTDNSFFV